MPALTVSGDRPEVVTSFKYLGSLITPGGGVERRSHHELRNPGEISQTHDTYGATMTPGFLQGRVYNVTVAKRVLGTFFILPRISEALSECCGCDSSGH